MLHTEQQPVVDDEDDGDHRLTIMMYCSAVLLSRESSLVQQLFRIDINTMYVCAERGESIKIMCSAACAERGESMIMCSAAVGDINFRPAYGYREHT